MGGAGLIMGLEVTKGVILDSGCAGGVCMDMVGGSIGTYIELTLLVTPQDVPQKNGSFNGTGCITLNKEEKGKEGTQTSLQPLISNPSFRILGNSKHDQLTVTHLHEATYPFLIEVWFEILLGIDIFKVEIRQTSTRKDAKAKPHTVFHISVAVLDSTKNVG
eukprot:158026-Amorphochlora_amoeboformis.AAC.1